MTKVTEQDVVHFLREKVAQIANELAIVQSALNAFQETAGAAASSTKGQRTGTPRLKTSAKKRNAKSVAAKKGGKSAGKFPTESIRIADQLG